MASQAMLKLISGEDHDGRRSLRHRVFLSVKLITTTKEVPVKLRNLSATGALLEGDKLPAVGTDLILRRGSLEVFATVRWVDGGRAGVEFDEPLAEHKLWAQIAAAPSPPEGSPTIDHRRPGLRCRALSADERATAQAWAHPQGRSAYLG